MVRLSEVGKAYKGAEGVEVRLEGDVNLHKVQGVVEECVTGQCACCSPEFMERVSGIEVEGSGSNVKLSVKGWNLTAEEVQSNIDNCDKEVG